MILSLIYVGPLDLDRPPAELYFSHKFTLLFQIDGNIENVLMTESDNSLPDKLEDLDSRLNRARDKSRANKERGSSIGKEEMSGYSMAIRIGAEMVAALIVGVGIGCFLDYWLETKPWFLIVFFFLGAGAGILNVYRAASGLSVAPGYKEPSGGVASMVEQQEAPDKGVHENNKILGDK
jgi:ATP synthase protein I